MAHGLEPHAKAARQQIDVVLQTLRRLQKLAIGQHKRPRHVVGQPHAREAPRGIVLPMAGVQHLFDQAVKLQQRQLRGQLKRLLGRAQLGGHMEGPRGGIKVAVALVVRRSQHQHLVPRLQAVLQPLLLAAAP
ncbi:hypothetical protein D3C72_1171510 [compost metagenome]